MLIILWACRRAGLGDRLYESAGELYWVGFRFVAVFVIRLFTSVVSAVLR
jgi:hypothetical protein